MIPSISLLPKKYAFLQLSYSAFLCPLLAIKPRTPGTQFYKLFGAYLTQESASVGCCIGFEHACIGYAG
jgi:hypothetical protein